MTNYSEYQENVKYRIQPKTHTRLFFDTAEQMPQYHRSIINRLAEMFTGDDLTQRLNDLKFCDLKTAREVLKGLKGRIK